MVSFCARSFAVATVFVSLVGCVALTGCGVAGTGDAPSAGTLSLSGRVHGGQQPVSGSTIQLWAAGSSGYGSAATPKLTSVVTTDAGGNFNFSTLYTCPSSTTQMYVTATQGNPGMSSGTNNAGIAMMAALGLAATCRPLPRS